MTDMTVDLTYKFQPGKFDIAGMERFYKDMAAEGLHLVDRGAFFSSFLKGEPADMDYRVETLSSKGFMRKMTDETKQKYEDCGWEYVCMMGFTAIFRAPAGTAREVYADSYEQATAMKSYVKEACMQIFHLPLLWVLILLMNSLTYNGDATAEIFLSFITRTTGIISVFVGLMALEAADIISAVKLISIWRRMKKGQPMDHYPASTSRMYWLIGLAIAIIAAVGIFAETRNKEVALPLESDGGYITLAQLGYDGERQLHYQWDSTLLHTDTIFCEYWDTREYIRTENGNNRWLYQEIYRIKGGVKPETVAEMAKRSAIFANNENRPFTETTVDGLDMAWYAGDLECVAVKGDMVGIFTSTFKDTDEIIRTLHTVAKHWENIS